MPIVHKTGQLPLSIGTSMAIEGLLGSHPANPTQPPGHRTINALWINVRTLVRNYYQSLEAVDAKRIKYPTAAITLLTEIQAIPEILRQNRRPLKVVFYQQPIEMVKQQFPKANYYRPRTDKQTQYKLYEDHTTRFVLDECQNAEVPVETILKTPPSSRDIVAFLTHYPKDLFWKHSFERVFLLESHSGKLKTYVDWHTKLSYLKPEHHLPLNEFTLQVYGDGQMFIGQDKKLRDELTVLAQSRKWNGSTSSSKVQADVMQYGSPALKSMYRDLMQ